MTQGDLLSPTIFNVVLDTVVRQWVSMVAEVEEGLELWGREVIHCTALFYVDDGLIVSTNHKWLQGEFDTLTGLFDRVGFWTNVCKMVRMLCHPCCAVRNQSEESYNCRMTGAGLTYRSSRGCRFSARTAERTWRQSC